MGHDLPETGTLSLQLLLHATYNLQVSLETFENLDFISSEEEIKENLSRNMNNRPHDKKRVNITNTFIQNVSKLG